MAIIRSPYNLNRRDLALLSDNPIHKWNNTFKSLQDRLRKDYCVKQRKHCCYCKTEMESGCNGSHIDHIVPKVLYPIWMYDPINLCLSCEQCNTKKGEQNTLVKHPHFDNWDDHLFYEDDFFITFHQNSIKGKNTIDFCGLYRHLYIERRLRKEYTNIVDRIEILRIKKLDNGLTPILLQEIDNCIDELLMYLD